MIWQVKNMKTIYDRLNKAYDKTLLDQKDIRKHYRSICALLEEYQIPHDGKNDDDVIQNEILYASLLVKRSFEDVFFDTYVKMFDYWYDLNYLERKAQMNVDIERFVEGLRHFEADGEMIYMPAFAPGFNHLYHTEIVLLDLKQYHRFIRDCAKEVQRLRYGAKPFQHGFSSCELLVEGSEGYVVFHPVMHRWYLYDDTGLKHTVSVDMKKELQEDWKQEIALQLLKGQEEALVALLIQHELIRKRLGRKLEKVLLKQKKKQEKKADKE